MSQTASIAALLHELDSRSPAGFAAGMHIRFTTPTYMFQTYPKRWLEHYSATGLVVDDPVARWGLQNVGYIRWSELEAIDSKGVLEQAKDFGLMNGAAVSVVVSGSRSIGGFARADREFSAQEMSAVEDTLVELHRLTVGLERLSQRDREALTELSRRLTR